MGWAIGHDSERNRDIGYGVPATCDHPGCGEKIDRGLAYVCGNEIHGGEYGCGLFFCTKHHLGYLYPEGDQDQEGEPLAHSLCVRCAHGQPPFEPTPDTQVWINHKLTDESWGPWRAENQTWVSQHQPTT